MTQEEWSKIKFFKPSENFGDINKIKFDLIVELDKFREYLKKPIHVICGTQGVHKSNYHAEGLAVDIVCPSISSLLNFFLAASRFKFTGIGVYPDWCYNRTRCGGLHLDIRINRDVFRSLWMGIRHNDETRYIALDEGNINFFIIKRGKI